MRQICDLELEAASAGTALFELLEKKRQETGVFIAEIFSSVAEEVVVPAEIFDAYMFGRAPNEIADMPALSPMVEIRDSLNKIGDLLIVKSGSQKLYGSVGSFGNSPLRYIIAPDQHIRRGSVEAALSRKGNITPVEMMEICARAGDFSLSAISVTERAKFYVGGSGWKEYERFAKNESEVKTAQWILAQEGFLSLESPFNKSKTLE